ncbi:MAG: hypothetical protein ABSB15_18280 [Bryobacteraceae bacterium]
MKSLCILPLFSSLVFAQANVLHLKAPSEVTAKPGAIVRVVLSFQVDEGFHVNSNTPADPYLSP